MMVSCSHGLRNFGTGEHGVWKISSFVTTPQNTISFSSEISSPFSPTHSLLSHPTYFLFISHTKTAATQSMEEPALTGVLALKLKSEVRAEQVCVKQALSVELRAEPALEAPSRSTLSKPSLSSSDPRRASPLHRAYMQVRAKQALYDTTSSAHRGGPARRPGGGGGARC
jgi:hypothetical protein